METSAVTTHLYGYDPAGNRTTVQYGQTGRKLTSAFDGLNRLTSISETIPSATGARLTNYTYDIAGSVLTRSQANGTVEASAYDPLGRRHFQQTLSGNQSVSCFFYQYDAVGSVLIIDERYSSSTVPDRTNYDKQI